MADSATRLVIVDDHELLLEGLRLAIDNRDGFSVVASAASVAQFRAIVDDHEFDVVVTDLALGDGTGREIARIAAERTAKPVLLMTGQGDTEGVQAAIESGCVGFLSKGASLDDMCRAISTVAQGGTVFPVEALRSAIAVPDAPPRDITDREMTVLELLAQGKNATEISEELVVSLYTVRNHIRSLLTKLHARSQLEAVVQAVREELVTIN